MQLDDNRRALFADRLRQACEAKYGKAHGIATRLAETMDVSVGASARWLRGKTTPEIERWPELAAQLGVSVSWLTGGTHDRPPALVGKVSDRDLRLIGKAAKITFPILMKEHPEASAEEIDEVITHVYQQLLAGFSEDAVAGELYHRYNG